jgi:outer membrane receptor protein involved in Fe transport
MEGNLPVRDPGATRAPLDPNARNSRNRIATSLHATVNPQSQWRHRIGVSVYRDDFQFVDIRDDVADAQTFDFFVFDATFTFDADLWRTKVDYVGTTERALFGNDVGIAVSYGTAWEREDLSNVITGEFTDNTSFDRNSVAAFGEIQAQLGSHVSLVTGTRLEKYEDLDADFTPRASVVVEAVPDWLALRGAVGRAFKAPNLQQQFVDNPFIASNPDLEPETSVSWEVGGTLTEPTGTFMAGATYFHQTYDNLIRSVDLGDGSGKQINRNLGKSLAEGVEVDLHFRATPAVSGGVNGTWIRTIIRENVGLPSDQFPVGQELPFRPDFVGSAHLQLDLGERWTGVVRGSYIGEQTVLTERFAGNRVDLDPYFIANVTARYRFLRSLSVFGRVGNLFDTSYHTAFDRIGSPFTAALGARLVN